MTIAVVTRFRTSVILWCVRYWSSYDINLVDCDDTSPVTLVTCWCKQLMIVRCRSVESEALFTDIDGMLLGLTAELDQMLKLQG